MTNIKAGSTVKNSSSTTKSDALHASIVAEVSNKNDISKIYACTPSQIIELNKYVATLPFLHQRQYYAALCGELCGSPEHYIELDFVKERPLAGLYIFLGKAMELGIPESHTLESSFVYYTSEFLTAADIIKHTHSYYKNIELATPIYILRAQALNHNIV